MAEAAKRQSAGPLITGALAALSMFGPFTTDTVFPAFESMGREFGASAAAMQQVTSVYLMSFAIASLFHGPISDALGRRPVMITSTLLYAGASAGCALSGDLAMLLFFRSLQGIFAGGGLIVSRTVVRDLFSGPAAQRLMAHIGMIFGLAPAVAPIVGGILLGFGEWPIIFWFLCGYGFVTALAAALLPETHPKEKRTPLRVGGLLVSLFRVAKDGRFQRVALAGALGFGSQFLYIASAPIFMVSLLHKGEQDFWMLFVPMIVGMISGSFLAGRLASRVPRRKIATSGFLICIGGGVLNVALNAFGATPIPYALIAPMILGFGGQLFFPLIQLEQMDLFPKTLGTASSVGNFLTLMSHSILAGVIAPLVTGTLTNMAVTSLALVLIGFGLWLWHCKAMGPEQLMHGGDR